MPVRKDQMNFMRFTKAQLIEDIKRWRKMYAASIEQTKEAQYVEVEIGRYKEYLKDTREKLSKVREERDLALRLLALRLSKFTT
jgi:hypothetical protein